MKTRFSRTLGQKGQATVEYAVLLAMLFLCINAPVIPNEKKLGGSQSFMHAMLDAYRVYWVSHYYVLNLPFP
ncbi:MAG: hypothetical protein JST54_23440 [Deltaproteobacteria bacterium]|nr:hypothetical protein [Deltaproteobacteria bacterium]